MILNKYKNDVDILAVRAYNTAAKEKIAGLKKVWDGFVRAKNPIEIEAFVLHRHDDRAQQFKQLLVEADAKWKAMENAEYEKKIKNIKLERITIQIEKFISELSSLTDKTEIRLKELDIEEQNAELEKIERELYGCELSILGAVKECENYFDIAHRDYSDFLECTEDELLVYERNYWITRLAKQVQIDLLVDWKIGRGNLDVIMNLPRSDQEQIYVSAAHRTDEHLRLMESVDRLHAVEAALSLPRVTQYALSGNYTPLVLRKDAPAGYPENRIVNMDRVEIMIATLQRDENDKPLSEQFYIPAGKNYIQRYEICPQPSLIGEYRNRIVEDALSLGCEYVFFVDNDLIVPQDALVKLFELDLECVGGWYVKKTPTPESATMICDGENKIPVSLDTTGIIEIDWALAAGLTLTKTKVFRAMQPPYYFTTDKATEDTYFCARAREFGIKTYLDTSVKAVHVDKASGKEFSIDEGRKYLKSRKMEIPVLE